MWEGLSPTRSWDRVASNWTASKFTSVRRTRVWVTPWQNGRGHSSRGKWRLHHVLEDLTSQRAAKSCERKITLTKLVCSYREHRTEETPDDADVRVTLSSTSHSATHLCSLHTLSSWAVCFIHVAGNIPEAVSVNLRTCNWFGNDIVITNKPLAMKRTSSGFVPVLEGHSTD